MGYNDDNVAPMGIISQFPHGLRWFACVGCILGSFLQLNVQFVLKKRENNVAPIAIRTFKKKF
jgi:hypothetical protein